MGLLSSEVEACNFRNRDDNTVASACASFIVTPGASRPKIRQHRSSRSRSLRSSGWTSGYELRGSQTLGTAMLVPVKSAGVIPAMVKAAPFKRMVFPTMSGSLANRSCQ